MIKAEKLNYKKLTQLLICLILISGLILFTSCANKKKEEELNQQIQNLQTKVEELQKEIANKEDIINQLKEENVDLLNQVPIAHDVQKGDSHWAIAYDYLTQKQGVPAEEARKILADTPLFHPILVGYKVWSYFYGKVYGTFITQGEARVSPATLIRIEKKKIEEEKLRLENEIATLKTQTQELGQKIAELEKKNEDLKAHIESLNNELSNLKDKNKNLDSRLNSVYFFVDLKKNLKEKGKIKGTFLGLGGVNIGEVNSSDFKNRIDLRETNIIELKAADFKIPSIKKLTLLPKHLKENKDFRIEIIRGGESARVHLLDKDKFLLAHIIIIVN
jgi:outer membrane murein-binding lipoprotein Lpp